MYIKMALQYALHVWSLCPPGVGEKDYASSPLHFMFIYLFFFFLDPSIQNVFGREI